MTNPTQIPSEALSDARMFLGIPPHDGGGNFVRGDGYFNKACYAKYGSAWDAAQKQVNSQWQTARAAFLKESQ